MKDVTKGILIFLVFFFILVVLPISITFIKHNIQRNKCLLNNDHIIEEFSENKKQCCYDEVVSYYSGYTTQYNCYRLKTLQW